MAMATLVRLLAAAGVAAALVGNAAPAAAPSVSAGPDPTERVSVDSSGRQGNAPSQMGFPSADGRLVAFQSAASNLVPGDTNGARDVFLHDRQTGATERISVDGVGGEANGDSFAAGISADGRFVAFTSVASNLVAGDTNNTDDVFVHDRQTGATERVSVDSSGGQGDGESIGTALSADGRFAVFYSLATNLVPGDTNGVRDVFVHDLQSGTTERVSVSSSGGQGNAGSAEGTISADGRFVGFDSQASNLVPFDGNGSVDTFVHDRRTGTTERVSVDSSGHEANGSSDLPSIDANGRFVAFDSTATNLVPGDTNGQYDVFVHDRQTGATERVSVDSSGNQAYGGQSRAPGIDGDGRFVVFVSDADNLVPGDTNRLRDGFMHDRATGATDRISVGTFGEEGNGSTLDLQVSSDGRWIVFSSEARNLVDHDTNRSADVFVRNPLAPVVSFFDPPSGITGSKVLIEGSGLDTATRVRIGKLTVKKFTILSPQKIDATVPNGATSGAIGVTNPYGMAKSATDYVVTFSITKLAPRSGRVGTAVMFTGVGFSDVTSVRFHGVSASFTILSPTSIRAIVPDGATTGVVTATSPRGTVTGPRFRVIP